MTKEEIRVALVEDTFHFRVGVQTQLAEQPDIRLVASVPSVEALDAHLAASGEDVDVVVVDLTLNGAVLQGADAVRHVAATGAVVIVMSSSRDIAAVCEAVHAGASDYLLKDNDPLALVRVIREAAAGGLTLSPWASDILGKWPGFTPREREVLELLADGESTRGISRRLEIAEATVTAHKKNMRAKIGCADSNGLAAWAVAEGFARVRRW